MISLINKSNNHSNNKIISDYLSSLLLCRAQVMRQRLVMNRGFLLMVGKAARYKTHDLRGAYNDEGSTDAIIIEGVIVATDFYRIVYD